MRERVLDGAAAARLHDRLGGRLDLGSGSGPALGFATMRREVVVQRGVPGEVVSALATACQPPGAAAALDSVR